MSQFEQIVKNVALESEKCNYNPEIDMNWCNLPMEMRNECVKRMVFKTRTHLSATCKTEKSLVEAKKYNIDQVQLDLRVYREEWVLKRNPEIVRCSNHVADAFVSAMLKNGEIENLWVQGSHYSGSGRHDSWQKNLVKFAPFRFKRLTIFFNEPLYFFLKNCDNLEKFDFCNSSFGCSYKMLLELPSVLKVKEFRLIASGALGFMEFLIGLVQKWIENDVEIGKSVQFDAYTKETTLNVFTSKFADRIVEVTDEIVRIRMNNEKSQILIRRVGPRLERRRVSSHLLGDPREYFSCKVISIDMPTSEYKIGDRWIQVLYERKLEREGKLENPVGFDAEDRIVWDKDYF